MYVTFEARDPCTQCGYNLRALMLCSMRVNKRSMRSQGPNLVAMDPKCPECRTDSGQWSRSRSMRQQWQLHRDDAEKVDAYRLRRWPELAVELPEEDG